MFQAFLWPEDTVAKVCVTMLGERHDAGTVYYLLSARPPAHLSIWAARCLGVSSIREMEPWLRTLTSYVTAATAHRREGVI